MVNRLERALQIGLATAVVGSGVGISYFENRAGQQEDSAFSQAAVIIKDPTLPTPSAELIYFSEQLGAINRQIDAVNDERRKTSYLYNNIDPHALTKAAEAATHDKIGSLAIQIAEIQVSPEYQLAVAPFREHEETVASNVELRAKKAQELLDESKFKSFKNYAIIARIIGLAGMLGAGGYIYRKLEDTDPATSSGSTSRT